MQTKVLSSFTPLINQYDGFLLDQWGVLHDGINVYPGALATLETLRANNKTIILLSNSGRRSAANATRLAAMGIHSELYLDVITSGEMAWRGLQAREGSPFEDLGQRCLLISRGGDRSTVEGVAVETTDDVERADFVLLAGTDSSESAATEIAEQLEIARRRGLVVVCCNPDFASIEPGSDVGRTPGLFALDYQRAGGEVRFIGKPWAAVYQTALASMALRKTQVLMVGDSLHHDIKGAHNAGIDSALTRHGVHRDVLNGELSAEQQLAGLAQLLEPDLQPPHWLLPAFRLDPAR